MLRRTLVSGALAVAAVAALPALAPAAGAPAGTPTRTFDVSVEGVQTTTFWAAHPQHSHCDQAVRGTGSERVIFTSKRPEAIVARRYGQNFVSFGAGTLGDDEVAVRAKVTQHRAVVTQPLDPRCEGTGGTPTPPAKPDCGTKRTQFDVAVGWWPSAPARGITLDRGAVIPPGQIFSNCPVQGVTFPDLLTDTSSQRQIVARIPAGDLFNPALRKHIVIGSGRFVSKTAESGYTTQIRWTVSLTAHKH